MSKDTSKLFCAFFPSPFFVAFFTCFYYTAKQRERIEHVFMTGIRVVYSLWGYEDFTTLALSSELSLRDYVYRYWIRFQKHLDEAPEALLYRQTWNAFLIATPPNKKYYKNCGFRRNRIFANRLHEQVQHSYLDFLSY